MAADTPAMTWVLNRLKDGEFVPFKVLAAEAKQAKIGKGALKYARVQFKEDGRLQVKRVDGIAGKGHWVWASTEARRAQRAKGRKLSKAIEEVLASTHQDVPLSPADAAVFVSKGKRRG